MITNEELRINNESYTHKDFYQIYPELLDLFESATNRYNPKNSNESDPGVVLLKLLAVIADKNNYMIDKKILDVFMSSTTQEECMRKLCEMMGYNMHYYKSAITDVAFMYTGNDLPDETKYLGDECIIIPQFTSITDDNGEVNFITTKEISLGYKYETVTIPCIEGSLSRVQVNSDNILRMSNLDDNLRFYLPEIQIAENGIWIQDEAEEWQQVDNLNTVVPKNKVWKFGFDNRKKLPYIQFPKDVSEKIGNGLAIYYVRTLGVNGNIAAKKLTKLSGDTTLKHYNLNTQEVTDVQIIVEGDNYLTIQNPSASLNGADYETIDEAYENYNKTTGTFNTLVTCRDYVNAIYNFVAGEHDSSKLVSNVQVSDIRNDINKSNKIVTFNDYGLVYDDVSEVICDNPDEPDISKRTYSDAINHFDLYLYPLNPIKDLYNAKTYQNSFKPNTQNWNEIISELEDCKTISHDIKHVNTFTHSSDIYLIKNYYKLKARIATTYKVTKYEGKQILNNVYNALYKKFNARNVDFGQEIPFDSILECIEKADSRIKNVSLDEPTLHTKYMLGDGREEDLISKDGEIDVYKQLLTKNILAGRVPLFKYDNRLKFNYGEKNLPNINEDLFGAKQSYIASHTESIPTVQDMQEALGIENYSITSVDTKLTIPADVVRSSEGYTIRKNENVQLFAPSLKTVVTYPAYVNYHWKGTTVAKDFEHEISENEVLYINYTDSNDLPHNIEYTSTYMKDNGKINPVEKPPFIIKPNFELIDSETRSSQRDYDKTDDYSRIWEIDGMYSLGVSQQIELRQFAKTVIDKPVKCYWITNDNKLFKNGIKEKILEEGEYFFYTDNAMTSLVTLGSGTRLYWDDANEMTLNDDSLIVTDDIINKGIGAFADQDWYVIKIRDVQKPLEITEMQIINLGEGDIIKSSASDFEQDIYTPANGQAIPALTHQESFTYNEKNLPAGDLINWQIRAILNLNIGPDLIQTLYTNQEIDIYSSAWKYKGYELTEYVNKYIDPIKDISSPFRDCVEERLAEATYQFIGTSDGLALKSSNLFQKAGGSYIPVKTVNVSGIEEDKAYFHQFIQTECLVWDIQPGEESGEYNISTPKAIVINDSTHKYTKINFNDYRNIKLPIYIPKNSFALVTVYYLNSLPNKAISENNAIASTYNLFDAEHSGPECISLYENMSWIHNNTKSDILQLKTGLNVIKVDESCDLYFTDAYLLSGFITITNIDIVTKECYDTEQDLYIESGLNYKLLGIKPQDCDSFVTYLSSRAGADKFYYNAPINNSININLSQLNQNAYFWFNVNNICNNFTIGELDVNAMTNEDQDGEFGIEIAQSSKNGQW